MSEKDRFKCSFCQKPFVREDRYLKHRCKEMERDEEIRTPTGQAAWNYYQKWMKSYRRMVPPISTFMKSRYYKSFIKFALFAKKLNLPDIDAFILLMREHDISPTMWATDETYSLYVEYLDRKSPPIKQAKTTINTLFDLAEAADCDVSEIFNVLEPNQIIVLLRERRISPWILLFSKSFKFMLTQRASVEQRIIMETIIRPKYWKEKFQKRPKDVELMKMFVEELGI